jgi:hypothetical protein
LEGAGVDLMLPKHLQQIADDLVSGSKRVSKKKLSELVAWYESDDAEVLVSAWLPEGIVIRLDYLSQLGRLTDSELMEYEGLGRKPTDQERLAYVKALIKEEFSRGDEHVCPSAHAIELKSTEGGSRLLGWLLEMQGQHGIFPYFQGVYKDKEEFFKDLRQTGHLFFDEQESLEVKDMLRFWKKSR